MYAYTPYICNGGSNASHDYINIIFSLNQCCVISLVGDLKILAFRFVTFLFFEPPLNIKRSYAVKRKISSYHKGVRFFLQLLWTPRGKTKMNRTQYAIILSTPSCRCHYLSYAVIIPSVQTTAATPIGPLADILIIGYYKSTALADRHRQHSHITHIQIHLTHLEMSLEASNLVEIVIVVVGRDIVLCLRNCYKNNLSVHMKYVINVWVFIYVVVTNNILSFDVLLL